MEQNEVYIPNRITTAPGMIGSEELIRRLGGYAFPGRFKI